MIRIHGLASRSQGAFRLNQVRVVSQYADDEQRDIGIEPGAGRKPKGGEDAE